MPRLELSPGAFLDFEPRWLPPGEALVLFDDLARELQWDQRHVVLFGKRILQPRLIAWAGELGYRYSGQTLEPRAWPAPVRSRLAALSRAVAEAAGVRFNHVLVNRYRDGSDSMGYHSDDEPELGDDPVVASLSLGQTRRFAIRPRGSDGECRGLDLELESGSLLVMSGAFQRDYRHGIPRRAHADLTERISLTFRCLLAAPGDPAPSRQVNTDSQR